MAPRINLPPFTRGLLLLLISFSSINAAFRFRQWSLNLADSPSVSAGDAVNYFTEPSLAVVFLVLVPQLRYLRFPWTFFTAAFVENNFVSLAISTLVIWFGGRYLERAWGGKEFAKVLLFVIMIPNLVSFTVYVLWHSVYGLHNFPKPIQGLVAVEAGFLVALKQLIPEHTVALLRGSIRVRIKHFPAIFVLANMISGPLLGTHTAFWLSLTGFLTSWIYLRFFRISEISATSATGGEGATLKGDASDTFSFVAFFPDALHPALSPICDAIWNVMVALNICAPFSDEAIEAASNEGAATRTDGLPNIMNGRGGGGRRAEAERRRALALRALDQRLNETAAGRNSPSNAAPVATVAAPAEEAEAGAAVDPAAMVDSQV